VFLEFLGKGSERRFLDSIAESDVRRFAAHLKSQGRCGTTVNRIKSDLSSAFNRALKLGKITFNPFAAVEPEHDQDTGQKRKTFSPEQVAQLIQTARGTDWEGAIRFGYTTGARLQDTVNLRWDSIDLEAGVVVFRQRKTARKPGARETVVAIHPDFENWLLRQSAPDEPDKFVFPTLAGRSGGGKGGLSNQFSAIVDESGLDAGLIRVKHGTHGRSRRNLSFHSLRHTAASAVLNSAAIKEMARRVTGHAEKGSLDRYLHVDLDAIRAAAELIPRLPPL
jgi:integrase